MQISVNGQKVTVADGTTLIQLIKEKNVDPNKIIVELNRDIAKKELWDYITLKEDDEIEILAFVGGG